MRATTTLAILAACAVAGCQRSEVASLRTDPGLAHAFETAQPLERAYELTVRGFTRCLTGSYLKQTFKIFPRYDRANRTATIAYFRDSFFDGYWATVDLAVTEKGTRVNVYAIGAPTMSNLGTEVEAWVGGSEECQIGDFLGRRFPVVE